MKHFDYSEFDSPDAPGSGREKMNADFLKRLDLARELAGIPFKINSGYRTPEHNKKVGGVSSSSHLTGFAADIHCVDDNSRAVIIDSLIRAGFTRLGIHKTFIHADSNPEKNSPRVWVY